jgi:hypothetical protein
VESCSRHAGIVDTRSNDDPNTNEADVRT